MCDLRCDDGGAGSARCTFLLASGNVGGRDTLGVGRVAPERRRRRGQRRGASAGAALKRVGAVTRFSVLCGGAAGVSGIQQADALPPARDARLQLPQASSTGTVMPMGGGVPVVRFALQRWRRKLREARFCPGVRGSGGSQRARRGGARLLVGDGGGSHDGVLPPARRWGV